MATAEVLPISAFGPGNSHRAYSANHSSSALGYVEREIARSTVTSQYLWRMGQLAALSRDLKSFKKLKQDWDSYGAMPPADSAVYAAHQFLHLGFEVGLLPSRVLPSAEGGVALRFVAGDKRALVEFLNAGTIDVMLYDKSGVLNSDLLEPLEIEGIANAVSSYLKR